jgi:hypothetical protein
MLQVHDGQCGLCAHFGEHEDDKKQMRQLVQIRTSKQAPEDLLEGCGHPKHASLHLVVTANSACDGFTPAQMN